MFKQSIILSGVVNCLAVTSVLATEDENTLSKPKASTRVVSQRKPVSKQPFSGEDEGIPPLISLEQERIIRRNELNETMAQLSQNLATFTLPRNVPNPSSSVDGKKKQQDKK